VATATSRVSPVKMISSPELTALFKMAMPRAPSCTATVGQVPVEVNRVTVKSPRSVRLALCLTVSVATGTGAGVGVGGRTIVIGGATGAGCGGAGRGRTAGRNAVMQSSMVTPASFEYLRFTITLQ
jgi:hypothetical protein